LPRGPGFLRVGVGYDVNLRLIGTIMASTPRFAWMRGEGLPARRVWKAPVERFRKL